MSNLAQQVLAHAASMPEGASLSAKALLHLGSRAAVDQTLSRLARSGETVVPLSKAQGVIKRFSEGVDLTHDIRAITPDLIEKADSPWPTPRSQEKK